MSDGQPDVATDLIDEDTWDEITHLPSDVSIRTSNHFGSLLSKLNQLQGVWIQDAVGDGANPDRLYEVLIYTMDEWDCAIFCALHGYYRQAIGCLRNIFELATPKLFAREMRVKIHPITLKESISRNRYSK